MAFLLRGKPDLYTARIPLKTTETEREILQRRANKYTEGNLSEWLRYCGLNFVPKRSDFAPEYRPPRKLKGPKKTQKRKTRKVLKKA